MQKGRQAFVICPLIEESDKLGARSATAEYERLSTDVFPDLRVELLHGRMPAREKAERMDRFVRGDADILVATSVVEVGVDVPNATIMLIEGAERFGLAQLHQFRGRVGRDQHQSYCLLFEGGIDEEGSQRLAAVAAINSGFDLAERDLQLRGPGQVVGLRQHGLPEMRAADLLDVALGRRSKLAAISWLDRDPDLTAWPPLGCGDERLPRRLRHRLVRREVKHVAETRITAGEWRGRMVNTPPGLEVRPTRSLVRQSLFDILGQRVVGARMLDLYAGAGHRRIRGAVAWRRVGDVRRAPPRRAATDREDR